MTRYIYRLEPARSLPATAFEGALASLLQQAVGGPVAAAGALRCALILKIWLVR